MQGTILNILWVFFFFISTATPVAYESSQSRDQIGVADGAYTHSHSNT